MEEIPCSSAQSHKFFLLSPLRLRTVDTRHKVASTIPVFGTTSQRRSADIPLILRTRPSSTASERLAIQVAINLPTGNGSALSWWRWRCRRVVAPIVNHFGEKILSTLSHFSHGVLCRTVFPIAASGRWVRRRRWVPGRRKIRPMI